MPKDPAFLFYSSDFLIGTAFFTREEVGDYIRILCHMHHMGGHMAVHEIKSVAPKVSERVLKKFKIDDSGLYFNERLLSEIIKRKRFTDSRIKNLKGSHMGCHMENRNENRNINKAFNNNEVGKSVSRDYSKDNAEFDRKIKAWREGKP